MKAIIYGRYRSPEVVALAEGPIRPPAARNAAISERALSSASGLFRLPQYGSSKPVW